MSRSVRTALAALTMGLALAQATSARAQSAPPPPPTILFRTGGVFAGLSPEGQAIMREAVRERRTPQEAAALRAARQRVLTLIAEERLDLAVIRRAQAEERRIVMDAHACQQEAMLKAYAKLSLADRRAFVEGMRRREARMDDYIRAMRERIERSNRMEQEIRDRVNQHLREHGLPPMKGREI